MVPDLSQPEKRILIGEIATSHGVKGLVKVRSFVEDENLFRTAKLYTGESGNGTIKLTLKNAMKDHWLAEVGGVLDRDAADALRGTQIYIDRTALPDPGDDEFYHEDLKGLRVIDDKGDEVGMVDDVVNFGASDLLDIRPPSGSNFYLPFSDETIIAIDLEAGTISVQIPETI